MPWGVLVPIVLASLGGGGLCTAWITSRTTRTVEAAKTKAVESQVELNAQQLAMDGALSLVKGLQAENERKDRRLTVLENDTEVHDTRLAARDTKIEELQTEIRMLKLEYNRPNPKGRRTQ